MPRAALLTGAVILVVGFFGAWVGMFPFEDDERCPPVDYPEGSLIRYELSLTPPGATRCEYTLPSGATGETTYIPWRSWVAVALGALAAAMLVSAGSGGSIGSRSSKVLAGALAGVAAFCVFFGLL